MASFLLRSFLLVIFIATGWKLVYNYWVFIPGIIDSFRYPILPNQPVEWGTIQDIDRDLSPLTLQRQEEGQEIVSNITRPNVILILVDDMGFNDLSIHGGFRDLIKTPYIDSIGKEGIVFKNAYAGHATCAPCRAALLTGRHASNIGYEFTPADSTASWILGSMMGNGKLSGVYHADHASSLNVSNMVLPLTEILLPEVLQSSGYHTVQIGKWHLGSRPGYHPIDRGFDESLGFDIISSYLPYNSKNSVGCHFTDFFDRYIWANTRYEVKQNEKQSFQPNDYLTDYLTRQTSERITSLSAKNRPYFLYLALTSMHTPLTALRSDFDEVVRLERERVKEYAKNNELYPPKPLTHCERVYGAMLLALDRGIGRVLTAIDDLTPSQRDNTMVLFTNDNGAPSILSDLNFPLRGSKATFFEGGIRVPMLLRYPAKIQLTEKEKASGKGRVVTEVVSHIDLFETIVQAANVQTPLEEAAKSEGVNLLPYLLKSTSEEGEGECDSKILPPAHETLFWRSGHYMALRNQSFKLQVAQDPHYESKAAPRKTRNSNQMFTSSVIREGYSYWMFDLGTDPSEKHNLMYDETYRDIFEELITIIHRQNSIHPVPLWPSLSETPILLDKIFYDSFEEGDEYVYWPN